MDEEWLHEHFFNEAEARAFARGLAWGDEPQWYVDEVKYEPDTSVWAVIFIHADEYDAIAGDRGDEP